MDAQGFVAALTPAVTDANARDRFLADPRAVLVAAGLDLPEWFMVSAREVMQPNSPSPCQPYATLTLTSAMRTSKAWRAVLKGGIRATSIRWRRAKCGHVEGR